MRKVALAAVLGLTAMLATSADAQAGYRSYVNVRYAYSICYPSFMMARPEAPNGDGRVFSAADGGRLAVYGSNNPDGESLGDTVKEDAANLLGRNGAITYRAQKENWAVFSGIAGPKLVYSKTFQREDQFLTFELSYPRSASVRYKSVAEQLSRCFHSTGAPPF